MNTISISPTERLVISRNGMQNTVQYQVKETNGWETCYRRSFDGNWKGDIKAEMIKGFEQHKRYAVYLEGKGEGYH